MPVCYTHLLDRDRIGIFLLPARLLVIIIPGGLAIWPFRLYIGFRLALSAMIVATCVSYFGPLEQGMELTRDYGQCGRRSA